MVATTPYVSDDWLEYEKTIGGRFCLTGDLSNMQQQIQQLVEKLRKLNTNDVATPQTFTKNLEVRGVPTRLYQPSSKIGDLPVCIFSHGGGWCLGDLDSEDNFCRWLTENVPCIVISVDYRLGPEHKLPAMMEDVVTVYEWICESENDLWNNQSKLFALGGSAGGANSLALCDYVARSIADGIPKRRLDGVVALAPITLHPEAVPSSYQGEYGSYQRNKEGVPILDAASMWIYFDAVNANPQDSKVFTGLSKHHAEYPKTFISVCSADPLEDDGRIMSKMLNEAGVETILDVNCGMPHIFWVFEDFLPAQAFAQRLLSGIRSVLA